MHLIGGENVPAVFSKLIGFFLVKRWHSRNVSLFNGSDWSHLSCDFEQTFGQIVSIRVKTLSHKEFSFVKAY